MESLWSLFLAKAPDVGMRLLEHMNMTVLAVFLSLAVGVPLGIAIARQKRLASIVIGIANFLQSVPCIALLAFSVPLLGIGEAPAIVMVLMYALLPIIKNTYAGISHIDPHVLEAADGIGYSPRQKLWKVEIPLAMPYIMSGIRISAVAAVGNMTIAAFAGAGGLGWFINMGLVGLDLHMVLLGAVPASLLAIVTDVLLGEAEYLLVPRGIHAGRAEGHHPIRRGIAITLTASYCLFFALLPVGWQIHSWYKEITARQIVIGTANFTETFILGYMYEDLIRAHTDITVKRRFNLSSSDVAFSAETQGDIDTFVSYTGTALVNFLHQPLDRDPERVYGTVYRTMKDTYHIDVSRPLGFNNTYALAMREETAGRYGIETLSDLFDRAPELRLGCTVEFHERDDGLPRMESEYGVHFASAETLGTTIRYQAIANGDVDVVDAYATDGLPLKLGLRMLKDDLQFFPPYQAVAFTRHDTLVKYPELSPLFAKLEGQITDRDMQAMNYAVDVEGREAHEVAHEFLKERGLI